MRTHRVPIDLTVADRTVACVVVTMNRPDLLSRCLHAVASQIRRPDLLVVVDNGDDPVAEAMLAASPLRTVYLPSRRNLGGAGGYAHGVLTAVALGADWVWLADDDGYPADEWTLSRLLVCAAENELDVVSPLVLDEDDPTRLAFPLRRGLTWLTRREQVTARTLVRGTANLFNGTLMSAHAVHAVGVPDPRLFVRGDEVEMHRRVRRSGIGFGTCVAAAYLHPQGRDDWQPILAGHLQVLVPRDPSRRETTFRNLGFLTAQRGLRWRRLPDSARYAWWYLVHERDVGGWREWSRLSAQGRSERFPAVPHDPRTDAVAEPVAEHVPEPVP
ncbi:galactofuranosyltransferase GlfT1 [Angustibacter luteus]|uniref:Glycosyltransferase n=1 Tax=Angustibacter luteus TaxID=658456 RepID=A0ABW1JEF9_9ACTN